MNEETKESSRWYESVDWNSKRISPYVNIYQHAMYYLKTFGIPKFLYFSGCPEVFVLTGGSIRHSIKLSLVQGTSSGQNFGRHYSYIVYRLVINDAGYKTKYELSKEEYRQILEDIKHFAAKRNLKPVVVGDYPSREYYKTVLETYGISDFIIPRNVAKHFQKT